jgi:hypothetical protein
MSELPRRELPAVPHRQIYRTLSSHRRQLKTGQVRAAGGTGHHQVHDTNNTKASVAAAALDVAELTKRYG